MNINDIIGLIILIYGLLLYINIICVDKANLFECRKSIVFTIVYFALSPLTMFYSVGKAMETLYQFISNKQMIIDALRAEIEDTKYKDLSDEELYEITRILAEHLEYAEYNSFDDIFQALEDAGYIAADEYGRYHYVEQIGQEQ